MAIMEGLASVGHMLLMNCMQVFTVAACTAGITGLIGLLIILNPLVWLSYFVYSRIRNDNQRLEWDRIRFERENLNGEYKKSKED